MNNQPIRVRVAPSPTGDPHVGTAYMALFNYCFAKTSETGKLILRIEDTDQQRSNLQSEQAILDSLTWLGLHWDEGPDKGGEYGPYRQSERGGIYQRYAEELLKSGHAFKCYRSTEELVLLRQSLKEQGYNGALKRSHLQLDDEEIQKRKSENQPFVIRLVVPEDGECVIEDMLRGPVKIDWQQVDTQVLFKSDSMPTYHLANVVDDHLMRISHVIRGEEWISSAPKHKLLYDYFGWDMPVLCHLPLLRNPDKSKLSKRKNPTSVHYYRDMGYSAKALVNYLGRMGFSMPDEREKFSLQEMVNVFSMDRISLGSPIFDLDKLNWLNGLWLREEGTDADFLQQLKQWRLNDEYLTQIIPLLRPRVEKLSDFITLSQAFFSGMPNINKESFEHLNIEKDKLLTILQFCSWQLDTQQDWQRDALYQSLSTLSETMNIKLRDFLKPLFIAISGSNVSPPLFDLMATIGADLSRSRLRHAISILGGVSKKQLKRLEKDYKTIA